MALLRGRERGVVDALAGLADCNPFLPERVELERRALGRAFAAAPAVWHAAGDAGPLTPNAAAIRALVERWGMELRRRLAGGTGAAPAEVDAYQRLVFYLLFQRFEDDWYALIDAGAGGAPRLQAADAYRRFARDVAHFFSPLRGAAADPAHLFALGFQARRAFHHIFRQIFGGSLPAARLRAAAWQSIFTDDARYYRAQLYGRMADIPTLIVGESGTGKELVARAIALSRYVPFDPRRQAFAADSTASFFAVNLSALSPTLIESELFGHQRGAFTGARQDRRGWFETCGPHGTVFLDEIGELDGAVQVKLLRVLQSREFQRVGDTAPRRFAGKLIAATHRDLDEEMAAGGFRADLYYRIRADLIRTPALREQLAAAPDDLANLIRIVATRVAGADGAERVAAKAEAWIAAHLGRAYPWRGNMRELEQCVRNILIRGEYAPPRAPAAAAPTGAPAGDDPRRDGAPPAVPAADAADPFLTAFRDATLTADELLHGYCARVYAETGSYEAAARRLDLNWQTVRTKVRAWEKRRRG